MTIGRVVS